MKTTAIEKYLKKHLSTCTMHRYSDGDNRKCPCGLDEARAELQVLKAQLAAKDALLKHIKDILIGRGFTDPLVQEIQAHFINQESEQE